jgi:hypothetical protein
MRRCAIQLTVAFIGVALAAVAGAGSADASSYAGFHARGWAAQCIIPVAFEVPRPLYATGLVCWTYSDGFTVSMTYHGRVRKRYEKGSIRFFDRFFARPYLAYGKSWMYGSHGLRRGTPLWSCRNRSTGLTCRNRVGHGVWLGRWVGYRII